MLMPQLLRLVTAQLSCLVAAQYVNAAAALCSHFAVVLFIAARCVNAVAAPSNHGTVDLFNYYMVRKFL